MEWETTLEQATVLEKIAEDTLVFLQLHKRVWPAAQRDALFWSHSRCIKSENHSQTWIVCNQVHMYILVLSRRTRTCSPGSKFDLEKFFQTT